MNIHFVFFSLTTVIALNVFSTSAAGSNSTTAEPTEDAQGDENVSKELEECHKQKTNPLLRPDTKEIREIESALDDLYSSMDKTAGHQEKCNFSVEIDGKEHEVTALLERFEILWDNIKRGLMGYCGKTAADNLKADIGKLRALITGSGSMTICDRDKFLGCHRKYKSCSCLVDNLNFRNYASDWWDQLEQEEDSGEHSTVNSSCVFIAGGDCPIDPNSKFRCVPGTKCLFKHNKKKCNMADLAAPSPSARAQSNDNATESTNEVNNPQVSAASGGYRFLRPDYPSIYCQCFLYVGSSSNVEPWGNLIITITILCLALGKNLIL